MNTHAVTLAALGLLVSTSARSAEIDWPQVDAAIGKKAAVIGEVHKYGLPRSDLHVTVDGVTIAPGLALGGWIAFEPIGQGIGQGAMMMGDLVLTDSEVTPVMKALLGNGVRVTGVHNHLLRATPATYYMHVDASGDPTKLAGVVREALAATKTPFEASAPAGEARKIDFDTAQVDAALGGQGKNNGGVYQFSFPRAESIKAGGMAVAPAMGTAVAINFAPTGGGKAAISGDFVAQAGEVEPLLKALQAHAIEVTALHNHMLDDEPRLFFVHFWAHDDAVKLAHGLRAGLDALHVAPRS